MAVPDLKDQLVLVTGSSRGLGAAIAKAFHREGATVIINYLNSESAAFKLAASLKAMAVQADVSDKQQVEELFKNAEAYHGRPITTIINNALPSFSFNGDARPKLVEITWEQMQQQLDGIVKGSLNTTQAALPGFEKLGQGCIINIGSNLVSNPVVPYQDYTTAKGALLAFTRTSAAELGPQGVRVNMVSGGLLRVTDASKDTPEAVFQQIEAATPLRRVTTLEDVADAVVMLASPWARAVTGQDLTVDGGLVMS